MKAKNVLAALLAAAMLCGTAMPAWAETADDSPSQYREATPETAAFAVQDAVAGQDAIAVQNSTEETTVTVNGISQLLGTTGTYYYRAEGDALVSAGDGDYTVKIEATADGCHVTLKDAVLTNTADVQGYVAVYSSRNLYLTLLNSNTLPGPVVADGKLTIDGTGSAQITTDGTSNMGCMLGGTNGAEIGGHVNIQATNTASFDVTGLYTDTGDAVIQDSANVTLNGNLENGVLNRRSSLHIKGGLLSLEGAEQRNSQSGGNGVSAYGDVTVTGGMLEINRFEGDGIWAGSGAADTTATGITGGVTINGGTVKITNIHRDVVGSAPVGCGICVYNDVTVNGGSLEISKIGGNGIELGHTDTTGSYGDFVLNAGNVKLSDICRIDYGQYGYGGKGISTARDIKINGGTITAEKNDVNDLFSNGDLLIKGGNVLLYDSSSALVSYNNIVIDKGLVSIGAKYGALSAYQGNITINGGNVMADVTDGNGIYTTLGDVNITGGTVTVSSSNGVGISVYQGYSDDYKGTIRITGGDVTVDAAQNAMQAFSGGIVFGGNAIVDAHSKGQVTLGSGDITINGNDCDITLRNDTNMTIGGWVKLVDADKMIALGGENEQNAVQISREEKNGKMQWHPVDCKYLHILKEKDRPADSVTIKVDNWTQGSTPVLPTATDASGKSLKVKAYYKAKGADDSAYTEAVPTAAGEYEVKLVVLSEGEYGQSVYYSSFAIVAPPAQTPQPAGSTTTVAASPTAAPRAEAKAQSAPVAAVIPQTADTFPYAGLAALMGAAALGMAGVMVRRKKHQ